MPELPEVETVCRGLSKALKNATITAVEQRRADLRAPMPHNLPRKLKGQAITAIDRRAKYIQIHLDGGSVLLLHLGMSGRMVIGKHDDQTGKHDHLVFHFNNGVTVRFNDPRRFGLCDLVNAQRIQNHPWFAHLGIEPLTSALTLDWLRQALRGRKTNIKTFLLDQRRIVGIGNIYASEALYRAGIRPTRSCGSLKPDEVTRLVTAIRKVLKAAIAAGGSTLRDYRKADGELGYFQHQFAVYDRAGMACPDCTCDIAKTGGIKRVTQGGRSSFYCATRQS
ncbi:MAG: bifunctional DNA-formamidopyrimidine glycosylase/DNA-(apurinic or apyrimidinic site) lyase [Alphaproteobacteria bacterium]|nr:bifunctional DNA-formamidopyrimidine glycosylase/DNA-(apurinic or apyrimidinic site) lyase [Alphaproteobacteria bacterium]